MANKLLVLTKKRKDDSALSPYQKAIFDSVLQHVEKICGRWDDVALVGTIQPSRLIEKYPNHDVLLVGNHAEEICKFSKLKLDNLHGPALCGLVAQDGDRRDFVATHPLYEYGLADVKPRSPRPALLGHLYRHLELLKIGLIGWRNPLEKFEVRLIRNMQDWDEFFAQLKRARVVAIDTETKDARRIKNTVLTIQFGFDGRIGWVLRVSHPESPFSGKEIREIIEDLKWYFENLAALHVFANAVFDLHQLIDLLKLDWYNHKVWDVGQAEFQLDENRQERKLLGFGKGEMWALERLCFEYGMDHYQHTRLGKAHRTRLINEKLKDVAEYGAVDVITPIRIMMMQRALAKWRTEHMVGNPYRRYVKNVVEVDGIRLLQFAFMERSGLKVDVDYMLSLSSGSAIFLKEIAASEKKLFATPEVQEANRRLLAKQNVRQGTLFGGSRATAMVFDVGKFEHKRLLLMDVLGLKPINLGVGDRPKFDRKFKEVYGGNPVVAAFIDLMEAKTLYSNFIKGWYILLRKNPDNSIDNHLRTIFRSVVTGRATSTSPNMQNIPERKERAKIIKRQIICDDDKLLYKVDFSAHEVRVWGISAIDKVIALTFWTGMKVRLAWQALRSIPDEQKKKWKDQIIASDPHRINYGMIHSVNPLVVTKIQRDEVKGTIFGSLFGMSMGSLGVTIAKGIPKRLKEIANKLKEFGK